MHRFLFFFFFLIGCGLMAPTPSWASLSECPKNLASDPGGNPDLHKAGGEHGHGSCLPPKDSIIICPDWDQLKPDDLSHCRTITNKTDLAYFVPWNTYEEWHSFLNANVDGIVVSSPGRVCPKAVYEFQICDETATVYEQHGQKTMGTWTGTQAMGYGAEGETRKYTFNGQGIEDPSGEYNVTFQCKQDWDEDGKEIMTWVKIADSGACTPAACTKKVDLNNLTWGVWVPNSGTPGYDKYLCDGGNLVSFADFKPGVAWLWHWKCHGTNKTVVDCKGKYAPWPMDNDCGWYGWRWDEATEDWVRGTLADPIEVATGDNLQSYYQGQNNWVGDDSPNPPEERNTPYPGNGMGVLDAHRYLCDFGFVQGFKTNKDAEGKTTSWQWRCSGLNGGVRSPLCVAKPSPYQEAGACGPADGTKSVDPPSSEDSMCSAGWGGDLAEPVENAKGEVIGWTWKCGGKDAEDAFCSSERVLACSGGWDKPYVKPITAGPRLENIEVIGKGTCPAFVSAAFTSAGGELSSTNTGKLYYEGATYKFSLPFLLPTLTSIVTETEQPVHATPCYVSPTYFTNAVIYTIQGKAGACPHNSKLNDGTVFTIP